MKFNLLLSFLIFIFFINTLCGEAKLDNEIIKAMKKWRVEIKKSTLNSKKFPHVENYFWKIAQQWYPDVKNKKLNRYEIYLFKDFIDLMITHSFHRERVPQLFKFIKNYLISRPQIGNSTKEIAFNDTIELLENDQYNALLISIFNTQKVECTLVSVTYLASYFIRSAFRSEPAFAELVSGIYFHPEFSPSGQLHQWVKIGDIIIDPSINGKAGYHEYQMDSNYIPFLGSEMKVQGRKAQVSPRVYCYPSDLNKTNKNSLQKNLNYKTWKRQYKISSKINNKNSSLSQTLWKKAILESVKKWKPLMGYFDYNRDHMNILISDALLYYKNAVSLGQQLSGIAFDPTKSIQIQAFNKTCELMNTKWYTDSLVNSGLNPKTDTACIMTCAGLCFYFKKIMGDSTEIELLTGMYYHPSGNFLSKECKWWLEVDGVIVDPVNCFDFEFKNQKRPDHYIPLVGIKSDYSNGNTSYKCEIYVYPKELKK